MFFILISQIKLRLKTLQLCLAYLSYYLSKTPNLVAWYQCVRLSRTSANRFGDGCFEPSAWRQLGQPQWCHWRGNVLFSLYTGLKWLLECYASIISRELRECIPPQAGHHSQFSEVKTNCSSVSFLMHTVWY